MKKIIVFVLLFLFSFSFVYALENDNNSNDTKSKIAQEKAENSSSDELILAENAKSAIMIEASTGKIIFEKNKDEQLPMASMTKMMTLLLIMEQIHDGKIKWDDMVTTSEHAASMGGSQIFLEVGEKMTVEDLVKGICIGSGNDAAVAMAEKIGGTEANFVKMMNDKAKDLNLQHTHFENACGLDSKEHYSSAYDMSVIAKELVKYDKILEYTGTYEDYLRKNTDKSFWLVNTNKLVRYYQGVDGLKTGYTESAGYCITTTARRNNMRLITVVMGEPSSAIRNSDTTSMLDYGFNSYQVDSILSKDTVVDARKVLLGKKKTVQIIPKEDVTILNEKTGTKRNVTYQINIKQIKAPVKNGDVVGKINIIENKKTIMTIDATVEKDVPKVSILVAYYRDILDMMKGNL